MNYETAFSDSSGGAMLRALATSYKLQTTSYKLQVSGIKAPGFSVFGI
jgi:hypothetical protein